MMIQKIYGTQQKQFYKGSLQPQKFTSGNKQTKKKKLKKSNLTPKANRERREKQNTKLVELKKYKVQSRNRD